MISHKRIQLTKLALALSIALATSPTIAQNTTAAIGGRISSADGKPASGATVSIVHTESGSVSNVVTDAEGRYVARGLRVGGPYTIIITKNELTEKKEGVFIQLAETAAIDAMLGAPAMQTVTVAGNRGRSEKFSSSNMGAVTNIGPSELAIQASIKRNLQDYARSDPRVSQTDKERGEMSVAGQNSRYNSLTIDGVAVNDTFGLEPNGSPTARQPISIEAIQSVQINVANYDVTQKAYTGANVNAVTKSGTNDWKGSLYYVFRNDRMSGDKFNASNGSYLKPAPFQESTKGLSVAGPLIKDTLFFYALHEEFSSTRTAPAFGPLGSANTNVGITPSAIASAKSIATSTYNADIGTTDVPAGQALTVNETMVKVDWNINDAHRAMVRYTKDSQTEPKFPNLTSSIISLNSHWYGQVKSIETLVGQWFADWTPTFSTEFKVSTRDYTSAPANNARLPVVDLAFTGALPDGAVAPSGKRDLIFGTEQFRHRNALGNKTKDAYLGANWSVGAHELKFGGDYSKNEVYNLFIPNSYGNYVFGCNNSSATYTYSFGAINCATATAAQNEAAVLENFRIGRPTSYQVQVSAFDAGNFDKAIARFTMIDTGAFVQDTWTVNPNLTFTYGVRVDASTVNGKPVANAAAAQPVIAGNAATGVRQTGGFGLDNTKTIDGQNLVQPRAGFNYRFDAERATQLRGGAGLFQGAAATVWMSNPFSNTGVATRTVGCGTLGFPACPSVGGTFSINPDAQPTNFTGATPAANVDFLSPDLRQPSIMKANLALETELPWYGLVFGAEYLYTKNKDAIYFEHLNLGAPTKIGTDGRELYYTAQGYNGACWTTTGASISTGTACTGFRSRALSNASFSNVLLAKKTELGHGNLVTLSLTSPMSKGLGWSVSVTRTDATDVSALSDAISTSSWSSRAALNPNEQVASNSSYLVKNRVNAQLNWQHKFFDNFKTSVGVFFEGRVGKPYSWAFSNDANGDGIPFNDLLYIPKSPGSGDVVFAGDTATSHVNEDRFWTFVNANSELKDNVGRTMKRNDSFAPWTNSFDLRISQEVPGVFKRNKGTFALDFFNFGNMINKRWGRITEATYQTNGGQTRSFVDYAGLDATGHYIYNVRAAVPALDVRQASGESQWAMQATLRYEF
jgi:hypothetical protein